MDPLVPSLCVINAKNVSNILFRSLAQDITSNSITIIIRIIIIILCVILSAIFAAAETSISKCNRFRVTARSEANIKKAKVLYKIINNSDQFIINILICINVCHIVPSMLATFLFASLIPSNDVASVVSTVVMTIIIFLFSETLPKYVASRNVEKTAEELAIPLYIIGIIIYPIAFIFRLLVMLIKKLFKINNDENNITGEDFQDTIEDNEEIGKLDEDESSIIRNAVDFSDYSVKEVMTPFSKMVTYDINYSSRRDVLKFARNAEFTRIPVYENTKDNIVGILHIRKYLRVCNTNKSYFNFKSILTKPLFVSVETKIDDMFEIFQNNRTHIAIVKDTNTILGMVTMEDVVEKLVGDIDEKNPPKYKVGGKR